MAPTTDTAHWIDQLAIRSLIDRYCDATLRHDWPALAPLFAPDAVWNVEGPMSITLTGREAVAGGLAQMVGSLPWLVQLPGAVVIDVQGDRARARTTLHEVGRTPDGQPMYSHGVYFDELVKEAGVWRFAKRAFRFRYAGLDAVQGQAFDVVTPQG